MGLQRTDFICKPVNRDHQHGCEFRRVTRNFATAPTQSLAACGRRAAIPVSCPRSPSGEVECSSAHMLYRNFPVMDEELFFPIGRRRRAARRLRPNRTGLLMGAISMDLPADLLPAGHAQRASCARAETSAPAPHR